jgi:hypothetical protein
VFWHEVTATLALLHNVIIDRCARRIVIVIEGLMAWWCAIMVFSTAHLPNNKLYALGNAVLGV